MSEIFDNIVKYNAIFNYNFITEIKCTNRCRIFIGTCKKDPQSEVIIKIIQNTGKHNNEVNILPTLIHPNIITVKEIHIYRKNIYIIFPKIKTDLYIVIRENKEIEKNLIKHWSYQLLKAIKYCHDNNIAHCDIKLANILLNDNNDIKLADFGSSEKTTDSKILSSDIKCTLNYMAPELFTNIKCTNKIDIWSIACVIIELCMCKPLFNSPAHTKSKIIETVATINFTEICRDSDLANLLKKLFVINPEYRISAEQALQHEYFTTYQDIT